MLTPEEKLEAEKATDFSMGRWGRFEDGERHL